MASARPSRAAGALWVLAALHLLAGAAGCGGADARLEERLTGRWRGECEGGPGSLRGWTWDVVFGAGGGASVVLYGSGEGGVAGRGESSRLTASRIDLGSRYAGDGDVEQGRLVLELEFRGRGELEVLGAEASEAGARGRATGGAAGGAPNPSGVFAVRLERGSAQRPGGFGEVLRLRRRDGLTLRLVRVFGY